MTESSEMIFKILIIGDSTTGKTNILSKYLHNKFDKSSKATIGVELGRKTYTIKNNKVEAQIWDTAGQERYRSMTKAYYKGALGALIVYDITKKETFDNIENWIADLRNSADKKATIILVGNKNDLKFLRNISFADAQQRANQLNCELKEINCNKDIENVHDVMKHIISKIYYNNLNEEEKEKIKNKAKQFYDINNN